MQLFNKSKRIFAVAGKRIAPEETFEVSEKDGAKLLDLYPTEIIEIGKSETVEKAKVKEKTKASK